MTDPTPEQALRDKHEALDALDARAFIQGSMVGALMHLPVRVSQETDEHGVYRPYFTAITNRGHRIKVTVEIDKIYFDADETEETTGD